MNNQSNVEKALKSEIKGTVLRPLADKFQELTRQIDSGEYKLPKTIEEAEKITEGYIAQAYERLEALIASEKVQLLEKLKDESDRTFGNVKQLIYTELDEAERATLTQEKNK